MPVTSGETGIVGAGAKILVLGDSGVGKTRLVRRFVEDTFIQRYVATVGVDFRSKAVKIGGKELVLQIWDTAGQERFRSMTTTIFRGAEGAILVYDVSSKATFDHLDDWIESIRRSADQNIRVVIVGNKIDKEGEVEVDTRTGKRFADQIGLNFFETSAQSGKNVDKPFKKLAKEVNEAREIKEKQLFEQNTSNISKMPEGKKPSGCLC
ncbi:ras-related protein Rab-13-like [Anneissia japonica]|uniref:ras-related protein Rab-13-like n=1 Tax=Anneissia japonica TaxID=1529436 RepID=UPI0014256C1F|nr:ras-related protein Rab-13-like [Anneissia japonica]XP_033107871.1 ras-related protein Rab-13-like [Anneissia japonica]